MDSSRFAALRQRWATVLGWAIFIGLWIALLADHYVFNPFLFGFAYYAIYVISRFAKPDERRDPELLGRRLFSVCAIALLYMFFALRNEVDRRQFIRQFERTCYGRSQTHGDVKDQLCDEIQSHIDNSLQREPYSAED